MNKDMEEAPHEEARSVVTNALFVLRRRALVIIAIFLIVSSVAIYNVLKATPLYRATATLKLAPLQPLIGPTSSTPDHFVYAQAYWEEEFKTRMLEMQSSKFCKVAYNNLPEDLKKQYQDMTNPEDVVSGGLELIPQKGSYILDVSYVDIEPEKCYRIVNTVADAYVTYVTEQFKQMTSERLKIYGEKTLPELKAELDRLEQEYFDFQRNNEYKNIEHAEKIQADELTRLNGKISEIKSKVYHLESQNEGLSKIDSVVEEAFGFQIVRDNLGLQDLKKAIIDLKKERASKETELGVEHPDIKKIEATLNSLQEAIQNEIKSIKEATKNELESLKREEEQLKKDFEEQDKKMAKITELKVKGDKLLSDYKATKELYDFFSKRQAEEKAVGIGQRIISVEVMEYARIPGRPFKPNKPLNIIAGTIIGIFFGILAAFLVDYLDNTVKNSDEIEQIVGVNILGEIPFIKSERVNLVRGPFLITESSEANAFEALRKLRVEFLTQSQKIPSCRVVSVLSAGISEGKSTIAVNLASSLVRDGKRVIIVDADLRNPSMQIMFSEEKRHELLSYLRNEGIELEDVVTSLGGIDLIASADPVPNSTEVISSERFDELISWCRHNYEYVIIDSPPILLTADSAIIAQKSDAVILVLRQYQTRRTDLKTVRKQLAGAGVNLLGSVLNCVDRFSSRYYSYYYYDYGSRKRRYQKAAETVEPVKEPAVYAIDIDGIKEAVKTAGKIKVLVVDDDEDSRNLVRKLMHQVEAEFREARDGQEAIELAASWEPDLILMDLRMPVKDGFEAIEEMRKDPRLNKAVIVAFTAGAVGDAESRSIACGADAFIGKPIEVPNFSQVVLQIFSSSGRRGKSDVN